MNAAPSAATTTLGLPRYDGSPGAPDDDYLSAPAPELGALQGAETNRTRAGWYPIDAALRRAMVIHALGGAVVLAVLGLLVTSLASSSLIPLDAPPWQYTLLGLMPAVGGLGGALAGLALGAAFPLLRRRKRASFVGDAGVQEVSEAGTRVLRFASATHMFGGKTRVIFNGSYTETRYSYEWRDAEGRVLFEISGTYDDRQPLPPSHPIRFAEAAERAWTRHRLPRIADEMERDRAATFALRSGGSVVVRRGALETRVGSRCGQRTPWMSVDAGWLMLEHEGQPVRFCETSAIADFQVFMTVAPRLVTVQSAAA